MKEDLVHDDDDDRDDDRVCSYLRPVSQYDVCLSPVFVLSAVVLSVSVAVL